MAEHKSSPFCFISHAIFLTYLCLLPKHLKTPAREDLYGDVVEEMDYNVGRVLDTLTAMGLCGEHHRFFTSDNGPWLIMNQEGGSAGLLRNGKGSTLGRWNARTLYLWSPGNIKPIR